MKKNPIELAPGPDGLLYTEFYIYGHLSNDCILSIMKASRDFHFILLLYFCLNFSAM